jgi:phosphoketolase
VADHTVLADAAVRPAAPDQQASGPLSSDLLQKMDAYWRAANYPAMIHKLTYRRHNHDNFHVRGYKEEGTTTTPFDMVVLNNLDRYQLALDAISRIPRFSDQVEIATARYWSTMERHKLFISEHGDDMPEVKEWRWAG